MSFPEVSVVMSVYNGARYLRAAVESILDQQGVSFEFIIVNDGSTDATAAILDEFSDRDSRVRVIHQENAGLTRALIRGCDAVCGEFIARQDADDMSAPDRLRIQVEYIRSFDVVFASSWVRQVGPDLEPLGEVRVPVDPLQLTEEFGTESSGVPCHGSVMFRRDAYMAVGGYRAEFYLAQDNDLWNRLVEFGAYGCVGQCLYVLRLSLDSLSGAQRSVQAEFHRIGVQAARLRSATGDDSAALAQARELCTMARERRQPGGDRKNMAVSAYIIGSTLVRHGDVRGRRYLRSALALRPLYFKAWVRYAMSFFGLPASQLENSFLRTPTHP